VVHRDPIIALAAWHKLPAIYYTSVFVPAGGLMSYGPNITDQFRDAADYVDRILRGEKPGDLPVQAPTAEVNFTPAFVRSDFTYLVPAGSALGSAADVDRPGIRVAAVRGHPPPSHWSGCSSRRSRSMPTPMIRPLSCCGQGTRTHSPRSARC
jgi:hypothetical protein